MDSRSTPLTAKFTRRTLHDEIVSYLRTMIMEGELRPGEKIPEMQLCERFGVSRTPLREALKVLAAEGTLQLLPHRGAIVARMTEAEVEEFLPVMAALEQTAGELACRHASDEDIARFRAMHEEMLAHYEAREEAPYLRLNRALHEALFEMADNATLSAMYQQLLARIHAFRFIVRKRQRDWEAAVEDHRHILAALEARDGARLGALLKEHVAGTTTRIARDSLEQDAPGETAAG